MSTFEGGCCVVTLRNLVRSPAMCCVVELEDVIVRHYEAELKPIDNAKEACNQAVVFAIVLNFAQLRKIGSLLSHFRNRGQVVVVYVFDG